MKEHANNNECTLFPIYLGKNEFALCTIEMLLEIDKEILRRLTPITGCDNPLLKGIIK